MAVEPLRPQPQMQAVLDRVAERRGVGVNRYDMPFPQARAQLHFEREPWLADGPAAVSRDVTLKHRGQVLKLRLTRPEHEGPGPGQARLLYLHGGGWCVGSPQTHDNIVRRLAGGMSCEAVSLDYLLAPEHPFPAALHQVLTALDWAVSQDPQARWILAGDSAGANLALATALWIRERGGPALTGLALFYGVYDLQCVDASMQAYGDGRFGLSIAAHRRYLQAYLGTAAQAQPGDCLEMDASFPLWSGLLLTGLPPVWMTMAELDILRDQNHTLAARLRDAGVPVELEEVPGVTHGFLSYGQALQAARDSLSRCAAWAQTLATPGGAEDKAQAR